MRRHAACTNRRMASACRAPAATQHRASVFLTERYERGAPIRVYLIVLAQDGQVAPRHLFQPNIGGFDYPFKRHRAHVDALAEIALCRLASRSATNCSARASLEWTMSCNSKS